MITERDLHAARATIDQMPEIDLRFRFIVLAEARNSRTELDVVRQQSDTDSLAFNEAAYRLAGLAHDDGDLLGAARLYRLAAQDDFADSSLRLATVLDSLAAQHQSGSRASSQQRKCENEVKLVCDAAHWYLLAYADGNMEAADLLDNLLVRLDRRMAALSAPD
ncbi:MAG TPA: hypothetical protein VFI65_18830 [Streptosporangiaceae bacterium]|nr:hypothetical protein [Streptosporangiaceae bacterium]